MRRASGLAATDDVHEAEHPVVQEVGAVEARHRSDHDKLFSTDVEC
jgi:hypothetical protein